jgi:hypothetical protein
MGMGLGCSPAGRRPVELVAVEDSSRPGQPAVPGGDQAPAALRIGRIPRGVGSPGSGGCRPVRGGQTGLRKWNGSEARRKLLGGVAGLEIVLEQDECADQAEGAVNGADWGWGVSGAPEHTFVS